MPSLKQNNKTRSKAAAILTAIAVFVAAWTLMAKTKSPHDFQAIGCTHCHITVPGQSNIVRKRVFRRDISELCLECHEDSIENQINHRIGMKPSMKVPEDLHLSSNGELTCITCHMPHLSYTDKTKGGRTYFLRRSILNRELCLACHKEEKFDEPITSIKIIAPVDNSIAKSLPIPFIGTVSDDMVGEIVLYVNGIPLRLSVKNRSFSTLLSLQEGINNLKVEAKLAKSVSMTLLYSPDLTDDVTYKLYYSHGILKKTDCKLCHPEGSNGDINVADQVLCKKCHEVKNQLKYLHGPVAAGSCTVCHDPHGQTNRYFLVAEEEKLCLHCHSEKEILLHFIDKSRENINLLREKGCIYCHDPHQSDRKYLLSKN